MDNAKPAASILRFGVFEVDLRSGELRKSGIRIKLQEQPFKVLAVLLTNPGQVVTREELRRQIWPNESFGDFDHAVNVAVVKLRAALADSAESPRLIETLHRRGYRFICPVTTDGLKEAGKKSSVRSPIARRWKGMIVISAVAIAGVVSGFYRWSSKKPSPNLATMEITRLTDSGTASYVAISPDGRYVVYALRDGEKLGLWVRQVATASAAQILPPAPVDFQGLSFSPDGNYVYIVRSDENNLYFKSLYSMPVLGGPARLLIKDVDCAPSFSPDGREFVFTRASPTRRVTEVLIANDDGSDERVLTSFADTDPSYNPGATWSPDGRTIAVPVMFVGRQVRWVLYTISIAAVGPRELYSSHGYIGRPVWLPRGDKLIVPLEDPLSSRTQLWTVSNPQGTVSRLTNDLSDYDLRIDLTADGKTLAGTVTTQLSNVWVASSNALSEAQQITSGETPMVDVAEIADGKIMSLSPDGKLWTMNKDGTERAFLPQIHNPLAFKPCGRQVVFVAFLDGQFVLQRVETDGTQITKLFSGDLWAPTCSPDGSHVYYINFVAPEKIWRMPATGGAAEVISDVVGEGSIDRLSVSPDGKFLAYLYQTASPPTWDLAVISTLGGPPMHRYLVPGGSSRPRWSVDGTSLQYLLTRHGVTNLWEQPLDGDSPKQSTRFPSDMIFDFNWSTDGKRLLMTRGSLNSDVILIRNLY
jgi:DNA-binding winged helix-turn-helix (wHTH) protein/Tol biopolymer transport system component